MAHDDVVIKVEGVSKRFGGTVALNDVSFEIRKGEVHAIVGENGAGKSTMMKILAGIHKPDSGRLFINGQEAAISNPLHAKQLGLSIVFQELSLFRDLTVADNIFFLNEEKSPGGFLRKKQMANQSQEFLNRLQKEHAIDPRACISDISVADQQIVEITRALSRGAQIIILDEPNSALSEKESQNLFQLIRQLKGEGITIIYVSHRLEEVFSIADRITVFRDGRYIATNNVGETTLTEVITTMIGRKIDEIFPDKQNVELSEEVVLEVEGLSRKGKLQPLDFSVKRGEVLGFAGLEGCGIEDIFKMIFGLEKKDSGEIRYSGKEVGKVTPWNAIETGWGLVPAERHRQGLMLEWSIKDNIVLTVLDRFASGVGFVKKKRQAAVAQEYVQKLNIITDSVYKPVNELSGGNQQKVVVAKWLATEPKLLILNDPTRGIDIGAKAEIYKLVVQLAQAGLAIIFTSSEMNEIIELCDRILVIYNGRLIRSFEGHKSVTKAELTEAVTGGLVGANGNNGPRQAVSAG